MDGRLRRPQARNIMARLRVEEPPQHGSATGPPPLSRAARAERKAEKRRASPGTRASPVKAQKTRVFPSPTSQATMAVRFGAAKQLPKKTRKVAVRKIAREYDVGVQYDIRGRISAN